MASATSESDGSRDRGALGSGGLNQETGTLDPELAYKLLLEDGLCSAEATVKKVIFHVLSCIHA